MSRHVNIHIEHVVVDGLPLERRHAARFQAALEQQLAGLLSGDSAALTDQGGRVARIRGNPAVLDRGATPEAMAASVAHSLKGGLVS
jgi:hypothetical protein